MECPLFCRFGYKWIIKAWGLVVFAVLLMPGFLQGGMQPSLPTGSVTVHAESMRLTFETTAGGFLAA